MRIRSFAALALALTACSGDDTLSITTIALSDAREGEAYAAKLEAFGGSGAYAWSIADGALPEGVTLGADGAISGTPRMQGAFTFTARVQDEEDAAATKALTLQVAMGDGLTIPPATPPRGRVGETYLARIDTSGAVGTVQWVLESGALPDGLSLAPTGESTMIAGVPEAAGTFAITIRATDERGSTATAEITVEIDPAEVTLAIVTARVATATVGVAFVREIVAEGGSGQGYNWSVPSGALPAGLVIRAEGTPSTRISGIPTTAGTSTFTLRVTDSAGDTAEETFTIETVEIALELRPDTLGAAELGVTYTATLTAAGGSGTGHQWNLSGSLPGGLTFSPQGNEAVITGVPDALGTFPFTIVVADDAGGTASASYQIDVYPPLTFTTAALPNGYVGTSTSTPLVASGGSGSGYTWTVTGNAPPGMSVASGAFEGTPTAAGAYDFTVTVTDDAGLEERADFTVEIYDALRILPLVLPTATVAVPYDELIVATGGAPGARAWSLVGGTVPIGLELDLASTGDLAITGTAILFGNYTMQLEVTDPYRGRATANVQIFVYQPLAIVTTGLPPAVTGVPYAAAIDAEGGSTTGYTWTISAGALPAGLSIQTNATPTTMITGISSTPVNATFTVTVTDDRGESTSRPYTLDVVPPLQIVTSQIPGRPICTGGHTAIMTTGGIGSGYSWTVSSGALPTGWALRDATTSAASVRGRATAPGMSTFTLTVTDGGGLTASQSFAVTVTDDPNAQRRAVFVADVEADEQYGVYFTDVCGDTPTTPIPISPTGIAGADALLTDDLTQLSPNGRYVAFVGDFTTNGVDDLFVADLDASPPVAVNLSNLPGTADVSDLFWSPSSNRIVYIADAFIDGKDELFFVNLTNFTSPGSPVPISPAMPSVDTDVQPDSVVWSPDGLRLAFRADATADNAFGLYAVNTTNPNLPSLPVRLHPALGADEDCESNFAWSPDSVGVLFGCDLAGPNINELFFTNVTVATPGAVRVNSTAYGANEDVGLGDYRFAPAGAPRLFYLADETTNGTEEMYLVTITNGTPSAPVRALAPIPANRSISHARWNPQGTRIAFSGDLDVNGRDDLYVVDVSGGLPALPTRITVNMQASGDVDPVDQDDFSFEWSPDGTKLVFVADHDVEGVDMAYVVDMTSAPYALSPISPPIADPNLDVATFYWSPDSTRVAIRQELDTNAEFELLVTNVSGAAPYTAQLAYPVLPPGSDVEVPFRGRLFRRDSQAIFFEAPLIIGLDESWATDVSAPVIGPTTRLSPILDTNRDVALMRIEP